MIHAQHVLAHLARLDELHRRHAQAFLVRVDRLDREAAGIHPAGVELMARGADPRDELACREDRARRSRSRVVDRAEVRVVADEDVAVVVADVGAREPLRALDDERQNVALRHDVRPDRHQRAVGQHDRGRGVVAGDEHVRSRAAHVLNAHLLDDVEETVVQHLERHRIDRVPLRARSISLGPTA